MLALLAGFNII